MTDGEVKVGEVRYLDGKAHVYGEVLHDVAPRSLARNLRTIATDCCGWNMRILYGAPWSIECTFPRLKVRGFGLGRSDNAGPDRWGRLYGLVILAWVRGLWMGVWLHTQVSVKTEVHGRAVMNLVGYGAERVCNVLSWVLLE